MRSGKIVFFHYIRTAADVNRENGEFPGMVENIPSHPMVSAIIMIAKGKVGGRMAYRVLSVTPAQKCEIHGGHFKRLGHGLAA